MGLNLDVRARTRPCPEAIHNAGKHARTDASITVRVDHDGPWEVTSAPRSGATVRGIVPATPIGAGA